MTFWKRPSARVREQISGCQGLGVEFTIREFWGGDEKYSTMGSGYTIPCICQNSKNYIPKRWDALYVNYTSIFFKRGKCPHTSAGFLILT